ncbi:MAG: 1,4-alpha-glucan branching enzyme, partial [Candidatus Contendobacter sp.]|nr:1,4-alpha-glucan branching enzyme [Candidatus Contendobacter sp.]
MLEENLQKIIELRHSAPYSILGPHYSERDRALTIRAFLPGAKQVWVLPADGASRREMQRLHPDGLFALRLPGIAHLDYQLLIADAAGQTTTCPDPYAIHEPTFTPADGQALRQGRLDDLFNRLGARAETQQGQPGITFTLWAPNASRVSVVGTFNQWDGRRHPLERHESGVWEIFIPGLGLGELYKYE